MHAAECLGMVSSNGQQGDFGPAIASDIPKTIEISTITRVVNPPALMLKHKAAVTSMMIPQDARSPMFTGREGDFPISVRETFPPFQLDHAAKSKVMSEISHAPRHYGNFGMRQTPQCWFVEMIEVRVRQQNQINRGQVLNFQTTALDALEQKQPVGEVWVYQDIKICELN